MRESGRREVKGRLYIVFLDSDDIKSVDMIVIKSYGNEL